MRLLTLEITEPLPGLVLPEMAAETTAVEAACRYRAIALTTLRQLGGLAHTRIRLRVTPDDALEAVRFWLLPPLAPRWESAGGVFRSPGWEIDFADVEADLPGMAVEATAEILCPGLGARWAHSAMLGLGTTLSRVRGLSPDGPAYFEARPVPESPGLAERLLPPLPVIRTDAHWQEALLSPLGGALRKALPKH